jgi:hypothetical protein
VTEGGERRKNHSLRQRIDKLLGRVHAARAEIVERGLDAVHEEPERGGTAAKGDGKGPADADTADARA